MKVITVCSVKGGCGKTASSLALTQILSQIGSKVLLLDLDPQSSATSHLLVDTNPEFDFDKTIREVLLGELKLEDILIHPWENVAFAPSDLRMQTIEQNLLQENNAIFKVHDILDEVKDDFDYVVIDTSPNTGLITRAALTAADYVMIPVLLEGWPVMALDIVFSLLEGAKKSQRVYQQNNSKSTRLS